MQRVGVGRLGSDVGAPTRSEGLHELGVKCRRLGAGRLKFGPELRNNDDTAVDTSSAPAAATAVVCADAAALAALTAEPTPDKLDAASATASGTANTNDIARSQDRHKTHVARRIALYRN
jgi:hypothetical protein